MKTTLVAVFALALAACGGTPSLPETPEMPSVETPSLEAPAVETPAAPEAPATDAPAAPAP